MEILSWVPAKSLISSFKLVCKAWHNLIHHPDFIKMHLSRGGGGGAINGKRSNRSLIRKPGNVLYQLHPPFSCDDIESIPFSSAATKLDLNFDIDFGYSTLVGSWNGILCLSINHHEYIILLNPCTRKYKVSPKQLISKFATNNSPVNTTTITYGFGCYNNNNNNNNNTITTDDDEYKVVRIGNFYPNDNRPFEFHIDIYSMSSNSWRRLRGGVEDIPLEQMHDTLFGVFLNGYVHWIGCKRRHSYDWDMIVSFNIREEEFGQVPMPPVVMVGEYGCSRYIWEFVSLMNVRGCLGNVYVSFGTEMMDIELEIWVMKEYGIKESWTKEFVIISDSNPPRGLSKYEIDELKSMTCTLAGDQIIFEDRIRFVRESKSCEVKWKNYVKRVLYDINKKKIDADVIMEVDYFRSDQDQFDYIETLVSLK